MSRSPTNAGYLPPIPIRTTYDDSFHGVRTYRPQLVAGSPIVDHPRLADLETRLDVQEKTTQQLLDRAIRIKQDLMESLNYTKGTWQEEKDARELLQEHVRTITAVVRQLNKEIKTYANDVKERDHNVVETGNAVKTLESHHVAGITDLRGRVARCDAAIGKLAADLRQSSEAIRATNNQQNDEVNRLNDRIQNIDGKIAEAFTQLERLAAENNMHVKGAEDNLHKNIHEVEVRIRQITEELRAQVTSASCAATTELEKADARMQANLEKSLNVRDVKIDKLDSDHHEFASSMQDRLTSYEKDHTQFKTHVSKIHKKHYLDSIPSDISRNERKQIQVYEFWVSNMKDFETRLSQYSDNIHRQQTEEINQLKREMREGFSTVHDTINNMKSVMEGKQKLLEENLRREMAQIRKMVVLV